MGGKAKPTKHTAKEIAKKVFEATVNRGGGAGGHAARMDAKCAYKCYICLCAQPSEKSLQIHFDSKHPKDALDLEKCKVV
eukprot:CAMPEP_0113720674 /NCGR_PEP_ID=MMETSP0038_2-20120614/36620_1 /TAXON_ID=2898 /ORGANISM="Cryptomonas paramecium" /LENGTH=79 /DNA_ID=CAMNT_0000649421 /DNA_START=6 /DNA_END=245 /DNA_ORIENTATION=- /assembly_acc=CAM_ASM_000170